MNASPHAFELAACVADYQLPDRTQVDRIRSALARARRAIVFIDWGWQAPSPRHPFDWQRRAGMLRDSLAGDEPARVRFEPLRQHYEPARTLRAMGNGVRQALGSRAARVLWMLPSTLQPQPQDAPAHWTIETHDDPFDDTTRRLQALYAGDDPLAALARAGGELASGTAARAREWIGSPAFARARDEWRIIAGEQQAWSVAPYPVVLVTVDAVVRAGGQVLLIRRGRMPGLGLWALPGGFLDPRESVLESALRELVEETGLALAAPQAAQALREVRVFDHPRRSQRGRIVTHAHGFDLGPGPPPPVRGADDAAAAQWVPVSRLAAMESQFHDDHFHVLDAFLGLTGDP